GLARSARWRGKGRRALCLLRSRRLLLRELPRDAAGGGIDRGQRSAQRDHDVAAVEEEPTHLNHDRWRKREGPSLVPRRRIEGDGDDVLPAVAPAAQDDDHVGRRGGREIADRFSGGGDVGQALAPQPRAAAVRLHLEKGRARLARAKRVSSVAPADVERLLDDRDDAVPEAARVLLVDLRPDPRARRARDRRAVGDGHASRGPVLRLQAEARAVEAESGQLVAQRPPDRAGRDARRNERELERALVDDAEVSRPEAEQLLGVRRSRAPFPHELARGAVEQGQANGLIGAAADERSDVSNAVAGRVAEQASAGAEPGRADIGWGRYGPAGRPLRQQHLEDHAPGDEAGDGQHHDYDDRAEDLVSLPRRARGRFDRDG